MHVLRAKKKWCQFGNNYIRYLGNYWAEYAETSHACRHPSGDVVPCVTAGVLLHVRTCKATVVLDLENG